MSSHKSRSCGFRKISLTQNQPTHSMNQSYVVPEETLIKEEVYENTNTKSSRNLKKKNPLGKQEVLAAIHGLSSEQLLETCRKYKVDTRRAVGRKVQALTKLYRTQAHLFAADFSALPATEAGSSSFPPEA